MLSGIMLPRIHDSSFIYDVWHSAFWNYVASIPCSLFHSRYLNSAFPILELCCLDSMFLFFARYLHSGIMLPRFHNH